MLKTIRAAMVVGAAAALGLSSPVLARWHHYGPRSGEHYENVDGNAVHAPMFRAGRPRGATAHCGDGSWSFSQHRSGTCSHHGGVRW